MTAPDVILPGATIGVLGGGQLGRMLAIAAHLMGYQVIGYTPESGSPISQVCPRTICASFEDEEALRRLAAQVSVVTVEFENIPPSTLAYLAQFTRVCPGENVLQVCQNRLLEKDFLSANKFPLAPYLPIQNRHKLAGALAELGTPAVLKTAGFGYDGKGQQLIYRADEQIAWSPQLDTTGAVLESFVDFELEISVIGARNATGNFAAYGPIANQHKNHVLDLSFVPAPIPKGLAAEAIDLTRAIMEALKVVGLLCVELFVTKGQSLLVNELAPRPHNSGHLTIEGCPTSQFEQHVRAICGLPLGSSRFNKAAAMANLLGELWADQEPDWASALALSDVHLHLYGKKEPRPGRKMGHLTAVAEQREDAIERIKNARDLLSITKAI